MEASKPPKKKAGVKDAIGMLFGARKAVEYEEGVLPDRGPLVRRPDSTPMPPG